MSDDGDVMDDTGEYCMHWSQLGDCVEACANCGHSCAVHGNYGNDCWDCECPKWKETTA